MSSSPMTESVNATCCATLVDQLATEGLTAAFVAPGSRSTPLALALAADPRIDLSLFHDERSAAFAALGHGLATATPALVTCTSGTAGAHFFAAVIEADLASVPLLVVTADRPPELWDRGAPQTIDQTNLFGDRVRCFVQPGPPRAGAAGAAGAGEGAFGPDAWRPMARSLWRAAVGDRPGPAHANLSFREPLTGWPGQLPPPLPPALPPTKAGLDPGDPGTGADAGADRALDPDTDALPGHASSPDSGAPGQGPQADFEAFAATARAAMSERRGVIVAGRGPSSATEILAIAVDLGWPVIADHRSGCRMAGHPNVIARYDSLLRDPEFARAHRPDVIVRFGEIVSSKSVSQWIGGSGATVISGRPHGRMIDPEAVADHFVDEPGLAEALAALTDRAVAGAEAAAPDPAATSNPADPAAAPDPAATSNPADPAAAPNPADPAATSDPAGPAAAPDPADPAATSDPAEPEWLSGWRQADDAAERALAELLSTTSEPNEIAVARQVVRSLSPGAALVVASSMPVRDVEWFGPNRADIAVHSNRGANGIDGTIATAIGVALTGTPTVCLIGDIAFLHDSSSLIGVAGRPIDLTVVVVDNDGGGIFSFLPQHELLDTETYERLFGTPHGTDLAALVRSHAVPAEPWQSDPASLTPSGVRVVIASTDRRANLELHGQAHATIAAAQTTAKSPSPTPAPDPSAPIPQPNSGA